MIQTFTLNRFIAQQEREHEESTGELTDLLSSIALGVKYISRLVWTAGLRGMQGQTGKTNIQGEKTYKLDEEADQILVEILGSSGHFGSLVSEERDTALSTETARHGAKYVVAFDPLDGSSNIGTNIPVGTIFTIFRRKDPKKPSGMEDFFQPGREIVGSGYSVYGAMTSFVYSCGNGVHGFTFDPGIGEFVLTEENIRIPAQGETYSVNEGYWSKWPKETADFIMQLKTGENPSGTAYSGRYVGSLVADFDRTLRKGGIFLHPGNTKRPRGKLRLLYECMPLAFIIDQAGGRASDGIKNIVDIVPTDIHERCPFIAGSKTEVDWFDKAMSQAGGAKSTTKNA